MKEHEEILNDVFGPGFATGRLASQVFEELPVAVFLVDPSHRIVMLNDRTARLAGMSKHEIFREGCFGLFCDGKTHFEKCPGHASLYTGEPWDGEADIASRHYRVYVRPLRDGDSIPYSLVVLDDRTEQHRHGHLLDTLVARLERLLNQSSRIRECLAKLATSNNAVAIRDLAIDSAAKLLDATCAYLVRDSENGASEIEFKWFASDRARDVFAAVPVSETVADMVRHRGELVYVAGGDGARPEMDQFLSHVGCTRLLVSEVKPGDHSWGRVGFFMAKPGEPSRDDVDLLHGVTALVSVAIRRGELIDEVDAKQRSLRAAVEEARAAARSKTMFLATMSHEIRTPLNAIIGFAETLSRETGLAPLARECTDGINRSAAALLDLLNDILDLSKLESGAGEGMMRGECDLDAVFSEMATVFRYSARARGIELRHWLQPDFPRLALAGPRVRQILLNLVGNSVKFTEHGFVEWTASFTPAGDGAVSLAIDVRDSGAGIPPDRLASIFDPFVQAAPDTESRRGTGLGLPIVRRLVEACGGTIDVESELGKGTVFKIRVARVETLATVGHAAPRVAGPESVPALVRSPDFSPILVDDVPVNLQVLSLHFKALGACGVRLAGSGAEALGLMQERRPSVVFTDLWMPEMDGAKLAATIKANPEFAGIPIVAVTADGDAAASFDASVFDAILTKPLTTEKIAESLCALFASSGETGTPSKQDN